MYLHTHNVDQIWASNTAPKSIIMVSYTTTLWIVAEAK